MKTYIIVLITSLVICVSVSVAKLADTEFEELLINIVMQEDPHTKLKLVDSMLLECDEYQRFALLSNAAIIAFHAGNNEKATIYAQELLALAKKYPSDWNYGNAIHDGHMVNGMVAIKKNDLKLAKYHLLESGKTPGSPQLNSFGPSMFLAKGLLAKGEKEVVIKYLEMCKKFWEGEESRLNRWISSIKRGNTPDFDLNLAY